MERKGVYGKIWEMDFSQREEEQVIILLSLDEWDEKVNDLKA